MPSGKGFYGFGESLERGEGGVAAQKNLPNRWEGVEILQPRPGTELDAPNLPSGGEKGGIPPVPAEEKEKVADTSPLGNLLRKGASSQENGPGRVDDGSSPTLRNLFPA